VSENYEKLRTYALNLVQASVGAVSDNFRAILISIVDGKPFIEFYLLADRSDDLEEIDEILCEFEALQDQKIEVSNEIYFGNEVIVIDQSRAIVTFRRRE
jgi:hypothetical protein